MASHRKKSAGLECDVQIEAMQQRIEMLETRCQTLDQSRLASERALKALYDYSLIGLIETDRLWMIQRANPAASSIVGREMKSLSGMSLTALCAAKGSEKSERHFSLLLEQGIAQSEWDRPSERGDPRILSISSIQTEDEHFIHFIDDVTEQRMAHRAIEEARWSAERSDKAKSVFLANISHEIRTPLNGIIGLSRLALSGNSENQQEYLQLILRSGNILLQIVNELLDYAKIEAGKMQFEQAVFSISDLLDDVAAQVSQLSQGKAVELGFILHAEVPDQLHGDRLRLTQCLNNLLSNALKFTEHGRVTLDVSVTHAEGRPSKLVFTVEDTGVGMTQEVMTKLFEPFNQADASTARLYGGTGLGLALVKQLVAGMGGVLRVESEAGQGSRFIIELVQQDLHPREDELPMQGVAVVVSDGEVFRRSCHELLRRFGWESSERPVSSPGLVLLDAIGLDQCRQDQVLQSFASGVAVIAMVGEADGLPEFRQGTRTIALHAPLLPSKWCEAMQKLELMPMAKDRPAIQADECPNEFAGAHMLVAEDNKVNQRVVMDLLHRAGVRVSLAETGQQALDMMTSFSRVPDAVLMDVQMPEMDGLDATRQLRMLGYKMPIIIMSASAGKAEAEIYTDAGANDFIAKPIDFDEFWGVLTRWVPPQKGEVVDTSPGDLPRPDTTARQIFIEQHGADAKLMADCLSQGRLSDIARLAHQVKGVAALVGGEPLALIARQIEAAVQASDEKGLKELILTYGRAFERY